MSRLYRDQGLVLRTVKLGEADRILTILTAERGKLRAVAKGARKSGSRWGARLEPLSHLSLQLYEGRELDTITQAEPISGFRAVREDLDRLTAGLTVLEAVDQVTEDRQPDPRLLRMVLGALGALERRGGPMLLPAFLLKLLDHEGLRPELDRCVLCGTADDLSALDAASGGVQCAACRTGRAIDPDALDLLRAVFDGRLGAVLDADPGPSVHDAGAVATVWFEHHLDRRLRSVHLLDR